MKKIFYNQSFLFLMCSAVVLVSCSKDDDAPSIKPYTVPATYSFDNVEYAEASGRVAMWAGLTSYLGKAASASRQLSQDTANFLWNNTNDAFTAEVASNLPFSASAINDFSFKLSDKTADANIIKQYIDSMIKISEYYNTPGSAGVPGKQGSRLFNYSGLEFNQVVAKGMMGALVLNQVYAHLDKVASDDNNTVTTGKGTAMEHDWDMAFGYLGISKDYDSSASYAGTDPARPLAIGGYFKERGRFIKAGGTVFEAFRKGRAAIAAKDYAVRDQTIVTIKEFLEKTLAAAAYHYAGDGISNSNLGSKFHSLSEGYGFVVALKYRPANSKLTAANYQSLVDIFKTNFYELAADASSTKLNQARSIFTTAYGQLQAD